MLERHRREWEALSLRGERDLTLHTLRTFIAKFDLCLAQMKNYGPVSETEISSKFLNALPLEYQEEICKEQARKEQDRYWVKVVKPIPVDIRGLIELVVADQYHHPKWEETPTEVIIDCKSEEMQDDFLAMNDAAVRGGRLVIAKHTPRLSYTAMSKIIMNRLKIREEFHKNQLNFSPEYEYWQVVNNNSRPESSPTTSATKPPSPLRRCQRHPKGRVGVVKVAETKRPRNEIIRTEKGVKGGAIETTIGKIKKGTGAEGTGL